MTSLGLFKAKHEQSGARFLFCDKASDAVKRGRWWTVDRWRKDVDGSCVTSRSVTPFTSGANNPHHFQRRVCGRSEPALSQPQLYHFKSLALELFVYRLHIDYMAEIKDWRLQLWNTQLKQELSLSLWWIIQTLPLLKAVI